MPRSVSAVRYWSLRVHAHPRRSSPIQFATTAFFVFFLALSRIFVSPLGVLRPSLALEERTVLLSRGLLFVHFRTPFSSWSSAPHSACFSAPFPACSSAPSGFHLCNLPLSFMARRKTPPPALHILLIVHLGNPPQGPPYLSPVQYCPLPVLHPRDYSSVPQDPSLLHCSAGSPSQYVHATAYLE